MSLAALRHAGTSPKITLVRTERASVKVRTRLSIAISSTRGSDTGASVVSPSTTSMRQGNPDQCSARAQHRAFGHQLPDDPCAARAERLSHRDLPLARDRAREQQVRDVRAGDQQHEADGAEEHEERRPDISRQRVSSGTTAIAPAS